MNNTINFRYYATFNDFKNNKKKSVLKKYNTSRANLIRCSYTVGWSRSMLHQLPEELRKRKSSIVDAHIDFEHEKIKEKNLGFLDQTEKTSTMATLGMLFTQSYIQRTYEVRFLLHLKNPNYLTNPSITVHNMPPTSKLSPDLWGFDEKTGESYLVESKGTSVYQKFFPLDTIKTGIKQVRSIKSVIFKVGHKKEVFQGTNLQKIVIGTHPDIKGNWTQQVIDPTDSNDTKITVDGDLLVYYYYKYLIETLRSSVSKIETHEKLKFRVMYNEDLEYSIGVLESIYNVFPKNYYEELLYDTVSKILDESNLEAIKLEKDIETIIGLDGIYVKTLEKSNLEETKLKKNIEEESDWEKSKLKNYNSSK